MATHNAAPQRGVNFSLEMMSAPPVSDYLAKHHCFKAPTSTMASNRSEADLFELDQVSLSVSADDSLRFLEDHGFFYQGNAEIGKLVDMFYNSNALRCDCGQFSVQFNIYQVIIEKDLVGNSKHPVYYLSLLTVRSVSVKSSSSTPSRLASGSRSARPKATITGPMNTAR